MITWMQKHKKWLVITIWVSTIAFVGAGGVAWGSGSFSFGADNAAIVGNQKISKSEYKRVYAMYYNRYAQAYGAGNFDEAKAKEMELPQAVLSQLILQTQISEFVKDLGLQTSDDELLKFISEDEAFKQDGVFNKDLYIKVLSSNNLRPNEYESLIKKDLDNNLLIGMFISSIPEATQSEINSVFQALSMRYKLGLEVLQPRALDISEAEIKAFYEANKTLYQGGESYDIELKLIDSDKFDPSEQEKETLTKNLQAQYQDEKFKTQYELGIKDLKMQAALREARKQYVAFRDGESKGELTNLDKLKVSDRTYQAIEDALQAVKDGETLKPIEYEDANNHLSYALIKLIKHTPASTLPFEKVKNKVRADALDEKQEKDLKARADNLLANNFKGTDIGFVSMYDGENSIDKQAIQAMKLSEDDVKGAVVNFLDKGAEQGYINITYNGKQALLIYKILAQKLAPKPKNEKVFKDNASTIKTNMYEQVFRNYLNSRYTPRILVKFDEI